MSATDKNLDLRVVIIGAGMAGIMAAINLKKAGYNNVIIYEKAKKLGGTWRENTYPGLTCDVPSHGYTYSFEGNPEWTHKYPPGSEIQGYFEQTSNKYGVDELTQCNQEITRCNHIDGQWHLETKSGIKDNADIVIAATGVLHVPSYPDIKGIEDFEGAIFHTSRWDHSVPLDDKRVAIIGTGSTGCQIVSGLYQRTAKVSQFQRTAQWIMHSDNPIYTEEEKQAFRNDPALLTSMQHSPESDAMVEWFTNAIINPDSEGMAQLEATVRENLESKVKDPVLLEKLRPNYRAVCKRLIFSADYYEAIQGPNSELVTEGIDRIEAKGIRTLDGKLHEFDVIALATGFKADRFMRPMEITGKNDMTLEKLWKKRPSAYLAVSMPSFPNFFMLNGPNGPVGNFSLIDIAESQWGYIEQLIDLISVGKCKEIDVKQAALDQFDIDRIAAAKTTIWATGCNSWYLDSEGVPATWPWSRDRFKEEMKAPKLDDYNLA
jgi:cation diffusion facilitator CzcD-associated flavoprotein CzcO